MAQLEFLFLEANPGHYSNGKVRLHFQRGNPVRKHYRGIVTGIAIAQTAASKVQDTQEEGDEIVVLVALGEAVIHGGHNLCRTVLVPGKRAEQGTRHGH